MTTGSIYTWGFCTHGQLGLKQQVLGSREYVETPTCAGEGTVLADVEIRAGACGHFHSLIVDTKGNVFAFGRNDRGQLGGGEDASVDVGCGHVPRLVKNLERSIITSVACGAFHCLALTADGVVHSWGWNKLGQLGRHTDYTTCVEPYPVNQARDAPGVVKGFAAGFSHSAAVLVSGQIICWGSNEHGQLGCGPIIKHPDVAVTPIVVNGVVGHQVAAGDNHLLLLTDDGQVLAAGDTSYGRLGIGQENFKAAQMRGGRFASVHGLPWSEDEDEERASYIAAGGATSAAISTRGRLFTWGGGVWGQLGHGDRADQNMATLVRTLLRVRSVEIAQDHMLAVCSAPLDRPAPDEQLSFEDGEKGVKNALRLWIWGRRRLLPHDIGVKVDDPEAQNVPAEVPLSLFGDNFASVIQRGGMQVLAKCGGSHSMVIGIPVSDVCQKKRNYTAAWCPQMSTVLGRGTNGGRTGDALDFRIVTRNEDGRDEKNGGLRFRVWATQDLTKIRESQKRRSSKSGAAGKDNHEQKLKDKHAFELQRLIDCANGTYEGAFVIRRPGPYLFHVCMLPRDSELTCDVDSSAGSGPRGEPLAGSPFHIMIDSGPTLAQLCTVQLRGAATVLPALSTNSFLVDAGMEAIWDIFSFDLFGNPCTHNNDRFISRLRRDEAAEDRARPGSEPSSNSTVERAADVLHERKAGSVASLFRARAKERAEERQIELAFARTAEQHAATVTGRPPLGEMRLVVRPTKDPGRSAVNWTPTAVGRHCLQIALLGAERAEMPVGCSPFEVIVQPGKPCASHSRLLVGSAIRSGGEPVAVSMEGTSPTAEIPLLLLLFDKVGNPCQENVVATQYATVRVENVSVFGVSRQLQAGALEWQIRVSPDSHGCGLILSLRATPALCVLAAEAAKESLGGGHRQPGLATETQCNVTVTAFVSAEEVVGRQRLLGSPCRLSLVMSVCPSLPPMPAEQGLVTAVEATKSSEDSLICSSDLPVADSSKPLHPPLPAVEPKSIFAQEKASPWTCSVLDAPVLSWGTSADEEAIVTRSVVASVLGRAGTSIAAQDGPPSRPLSSHVASPSVALDVSQIGAFLAARAANSSDQDVPEVFERHSRQCSRPPSVGACRSRVSSAGGTVRSDAGGAATLDSGRPPACKKGPPALCSQQSFEEELLQRRELLAERCSSPRKLYAALLPEDADCSACASVPSPIVLPAEAQLAASFASPPLGETKTASIDSSAMAISSPPVGGGLGASPMASFLQAGTLVPPASPARPPPQRGAAQPVSRSKPKPKPKQVSQPALRAGTLAPTTGTRRKFQSSLSGGGSGLVRELGPMALPSPWPRLS